MSYVVASIRIIAASKIAKSRWSCTELGYVKPCALPKSEGITTSLEVTTDAKAARLRSVLQLSIARVFVSIQFMR